MELSARKTLSRGLKRTFSEKGVKLASVFFILYFTSNSLLSGVSDNYASYLLGKTGFTVNLGFSDQSLLAGYALIIFLSVGATLIGLRSFSSQKKISTEIKEAEVLSMFKDIVSVVVNGSVATVMISAGSLFFLLPGIYFAIGFIIFPAVIANESERLRSLLRSWEITKNQRSKLAILGILLFILTTLPSASAAFGNLETFSTLIKSFETVLGIAVISDLYEKLKEGEDRE